MLKKIPIVLFTTIILSCSNNKQDVDLQKGIPTDTSGKVSTILFSDFQAIDSSEVVLYPLILERTTSDPSFSSGSSSERTNYWNVIFYNSNTNTQHLLVDNKKVVITSINLEKNSSAQNKERISDRVNIGKDYIFYNAITTDFNNNKVLDADDPTYLYISDKSGNNFRQLSPENYDITSWQILANSTKIVLQARKDSNGDRRFDQNDEQIPLIVDISKDKFATEIFSKFYLDSIKHQLSKIWNAGK
jgi:hypothetical protein